MMPGSGTRIFKETTSISGFHQSVSTTTKSFGSNDLLLDRLLDDHAIISLLFVM